MHYIQTVFYFYKCITLVVEYNNFHSQRFHLIFSIYRQPQQTDYFAYVILPFLLMHIYYFHYRVTLVLLPPKPLLRYMVVLFEVCKNTADYL